MIRKIISGGQTGADQGALDAAMELGIPHGGWLPKGRKTEEGPLPEKYDLQEMPTAGCQARTEQNVVDSDGTLILSHGKLTGGPAKARAFANKHHRPHLHVDLGKTNAFQASRAIQSWIRAHDIEILNVAGPRASEDPDIYQAARTILKAVFSLDLIGAEMPDPRRVAPDLPRTVFEAVNRLISEMPLKDKTTIANMHEEELDALLPILGEYIWAKYGLGAENRDLRQSCLIRSGRADFKDKDCPAVIIFELWKKLGETYRLRVLK